MEIKNTSQFVERTRDLVKNYQGEFEMTLLLNAAVGLIFCGYEAGIIPPDMGVSKITSLKWDSSYTDKSTGMPEQQTLDCLVKHIRNSIAHNRFSFENKSKRIVGIIFKDKNASKSEECSISLSIDDFKSISLTVSELHTSSACPK